MSGAAIRGPERGTVCSPCPVRTAGKVTSPHNYRELADRVRELTADTQRIRSDYDRAEVRGVSPDGSVRVLMRAGTVLSLDIDPAAMNHDNVYLASQVVAALRQAEEQTAQFLSSRATPLADALGQLRELFP
jgi:DNA-binding protein YbaB